MNNNVNILLEICKNLTEQHIIEACTKYEKELIKDYDTEINYIEYNNKRFRLKPTIRIANDEFLNNEIKLNSDKYKQNGEIFLTADNFIDFFNIKFKNTKHIKLISTKNDVKYFLCCQGKNYEKEHKEGILTADLSKQYSILDRLNVGDIVFNYSEAEIKSISTVLEACKKNNNARIVKVKYKDLDKPITLEHIRNLLKDKDKDFANPFVFQKGNWRAKLKGYIHYMKKDLVDLIIDKNKYNEILDNNKDDNKGKDMIKPPLNQILYGPPGTGKTYSIKKYIDNIIENNPGLNVENEERRINNVVKDLNWYYAIALSMYQTGKNNKYKVSDLLNQKIIKAFSLTRDNKHIRAALWAQMQIHTNENCPNVNYTNRLAPFIFEKNENSEWYLTEEGIKFVEENLSEQLEQLNSKSNTRKKEDFYKFITFHQSYSYEEFIEGIKPQIKDDDNDLKITYEYNKGIFKEICQEANSDPLNNYLLIIDEINRGNISKIFGEIITLIEDNKRVLPNGERIFENTITEKEQLLVTLPYTKRKFGVPNNLYILGTMNTSDRSIASIDIALRRRFKFKEMMPEIDLVADFKCNFQECFKTLNERISILLDRDHQIGHSYFIKEKHKDLGTEELKEIWFDSIIPLLNESFYGDWDKLQAILGEAKADESSFIKKQTINKTTFAKEIDICETESFDFNLKCDFNLAMKNAFGDKFTIGETNAQ